MKSISPSLRLLWLQHTLCVVNDRTVFCQLLQEADADGSGTLDQEEFINMFDSLFDLKGKVNYS